MEKQLQQNKDIIRLVNIGVLEKEYSSKCSSPSFETKEQH
jgi:hypothetical protein